MSTYVIPVPSPLAETVETFCRNKGITYTYENGEELFLGDPREVALGFKNEREFEQVVKFTRRLKETL